MKLILHERHAKSYAFMAIPSGEDYVAVCELAGERETEARQAVKQLVPLGVFPVHAHLLRYAVRATDEEIGVAFTPKEISIWDFDDDENGGPTAEQKLADARAAQAAIPRPDFTLPRACVYDVSTAVMMPRSLANIPSRDKVVNCCEIVIDSAAAIAAIDKTIKTYGSTSNIKVGTIGTIDVCNNAIQGHVVFFDARNRSVITAGSAKTILKSTKVAASYIANRTASISKASCVSPSIAVVFGSTVEDGLIRPAPMVASGGSDDSTPLPQPTIHHLAYMGAGAFEHYMSFTVSTSIVTPPTVVSSPIAARSLLTIPQSFIPLFVPLGDEVIRTIVHTLLRLPENEKVLGAEGSVLYRVAKMSDVAKLPATFQALMEEVVGKRCTGGAAVPKEKREEAPAAKEDGPKPIAFAATAPKGIIKLVSSSDSVADRRKVIDLTALKLKLTIANSLTHIAITPMDYYHYRVDGFNDDGWGCAYRSLQLVFAWCQRQGCIAMDVAVPSHGDIQKLLSVIDHEKEGKRDFVGSKEWIGSFEVMLVLQHYIKGLECTLQRVETGDELATSATIQRLLANHFEKGGAPVMIGGSAYAHTIIGINANIRTAEAQYLIADPHYCSTDAPDAHTVVQKGWVGWKDAKTFFKADSWYNMCVPRTYDVERQ